MAGESWIEEDQDEVLRMRYRLRRRLFSDTSEHQRVEVVETAGYGKMLFTDDIAMISERDEAVYHEMIAHVPLFVERDVCRVLVIGGGDGGTVREVLRHPSVVHCRLVEIDGMVVQSCREHFPQTAEALGDPRVEVEIRDGVDFVRRTAERFDLVLVDSSDPLGPAVPLFGEAFYSDVQRILTENGVVVSQAHSPFYGPEAQVALLQILRGLFPRVQLYNYSNLIYPGGLWSFAYASKGDRCPVGEFDPRSVEASGLAFEYYSADVHRAAFVHPAFQARRLAGCLTPLGR